MKKDMIVKITNLGWKGVSQPIGIGWTSHFGGQKLVFLAGKFVFNRAYARTLELEEVYNCHVTKNHVALRIRDYTGQKAGYWHNYVLQKSKHDHHVAMTWSTAFKAFFSLLTVTSHLVFW